jgi:hypothetical protein
MKVKCAQCGTRFEAKRSDAKVCSTTCRVYLHRLNKLVDSYRAQLAPKLSPSEAEAAKVLKETIAGHTSGRAKTSPKTKAIFDCLGRISRNGNSVSPKQWSDLIRALKAADVTTFTSFSFWGSLHAPLVSAAKVTARYVDEFGFSSMRETERVELAKSCRKILEDYVKEYPTTSLISDDYVIEIPNP